MQLVQDGWQIQIMLVAIWPLSFGAHLGILFIIKVEILIDIKWSYRSPQSC